MPAVYLAESCGRSKQVHSTYWGMRMEVQGILGILVLFVDIYAILKIVQSSKDVVMKAVWIAVVLLLPVLGVIVWYLFGPGGRSG